MWASIEQEGREGLWFFAVLFGLFGCLWAGDYLMEVCRDARRGIQDPWRNAWLRRRKRRIEPNEPDD